MGIEQRRLRFASIQGLDREDLPLAAEVWYDNIVRQVWSTRDVIKLAILFTRYMATPREDMLGLSYIERTYSMDVQAVRDSLRRMQMYGVIEAFSILDNQIHVSMCLSLMQRVRVLEIRARVEELSGPSALYAFLDGKGTDHWSPPEPAVEQTGEPATGNGQPPRALAAAE